jgi:hypothetical protein
MILPGIGAIFAGYNGTIPVLRGTAQVSTQASGTSFAPTMPTHFAGDVLLVFVSYAGHTNVSAGGSWAEEAQAVRNPSTPDVGIALFSLTATGSAHTITVSNGNNDVIIAHAYAVRNSAGGVEAASSATNDPPSLSPSWGSGNAIWFAAGALTVSGPAAPPTRFGDSVKTDGTGGATSLFTCDKSDTVGTLNPAAFTGGGQGATITAVVQPGTA